MRFRWRKLSGRGLRRNMKGRNCRQMAEQQVADFTIEQVEFLVL